jgi:hypothetical protein
MKKVKKNTLMIFKQTQGHFHEFFILKKGDVTNENSKIMFNIIIYIIVDIIMDEVLSIFHS